MKIISYVLIGIITYLIQAQLFPVLFRTIWQPDIILVWVALLSVIRGRRFGMIAAIAGGLVRDIIIGNFFGLHLFPYMIVAYLAPVLGYEIYEEQWYRSFLAVAMATFVDGVIRYGMLQVAGFSDNLFMYIWHYIWPCLWINSILAIAVHEIIWRFDEEREYF